MIDPEFAVYDAVTDEVKLMYPDLYMTGDVSFAPSQFPAVSIVEKNNSVLLGMRTNNIENAVSLMYEVNVYSNKVGYSKMEAKEILGAVDDAFTKIGFTRTFSNPVQNLEDKTVFRIVARYEANMDRDFVVYHN